MSLNRHKGFTLVEVMVALSVVAVAIPALMGLIMTQMDNADYIRERSMAEWVAENLIEEYRIDRRLNGKKLAGKVTGTQELAGIEWHWQMQMMKTPNEDVGELEVLVARTNQDLNDNPLSSVRSFFLN